MMTQELTPQEVLAKIRARISNTPEKVVKLHKHSWEFGVQDDPAIEDAHLAEWQQTWEYVFDITAWDNAFYVEQGCMGTVHRNMEERAVERWCAENLNGEYDHFWHIDKDQHWFAFENLNAATLFKMRWE